MEDPVAFYPKGFGRKASFRCERRCVSCSEFNDVKNLNTSKLLFILVLMKFLNVIKCYASTKNDTLFTDLAFSKDQKGTGKLVMHLLNYLRIALQSNEMYVSAKANQLIFHIRLLKGILTGKIYTINTCSSTHQGAHSIMQVCCLWTIFPNPTK